MLPFVALLLFAILGMAALNVDMGLAFGTKARLESAAETLALERSRLGGPAGASSADQASALRGLLESLIASSPPAGGGGIAPLPVEGPVLGDDGEVELSQRIPLLFGMAAIPNRDAEGLSLRRLREARESGSGLLESGGLRGRGLAPGARARALPRPVLRVGLPQPVPFGGSLPGLADVALERAALLAGAPGLVYVDASGGLRLDDPEGPLVGRVIAHPANGQCRGADCQGWRVGDFLDFDFDAPVLPVLEGDAYVPVYATGCNRVLGYVGATLAPAGTTLALQPFAPGPVPENASAVPHPFVPTAGGPDCAELQVADVRRLGDSLPLPLLQVAGLGRGELLATEAP